jgi:hypothetical protein
MRNGRGLVRAAVALICFGSAGIVPMGGGRGVAYGFGQQPMP